MKRISCPYLGLKDDPTTTLSFPSEGNFCHQASPVAPVRGTYQEKYCLSANHTACPLFQTTRPLPLPPPAAIHASPISMLKGRQVTALIGIPALLIIFTILVYAWNNFGFQLSGMRSIPETGPGSSGWNFGLLGAKPKGTITPFTQNSASPSPAKTRINCPLPNNWVTYIVNPTDSLYRLSVIYGVSVQQLQQANCKGSDTLILPGEVIYVPFIPTNTPIAGIVKKPGVVPTGTNSSNPPSIVATNTPLLPNESTPTNTVVSTITVAPTIPIPTPTPTIQPTLPPATPSPLTPTPRPTILPTLPPATPTSIIIPPTATRRPRKPTRTPLPSPTAIIPLPTATPLPTNPPPTATDAPPPSPTAPPPQPTDTPQSQAPDPTDAIILPTMIDPIITPIPTIVP